MKVGLVLGAGGVVGASWTIGALEALGTVALSACGKQLRSAAGGIRATARDYTAVDDANKLALQRAARVR